MKLKSLNRPPLWKIASALLIPLLCAPAHATYDRACMALLNPNTKQAEAFAFARDEWTASIRNVFGIHRDLSETEFEAFMDISHGLALKAKFANGTIGLFEHNAPNMEKLTKLLRASELVEVKHYPETSMEVGNLFLGACAVVGRENCNTYADFQGWTSTEPRPFSMLEERAIKWTTLHLIPPDSMGKVHQAWSEEQRKKNYTLALEAKIALALYLIAAVFSEEDADALYNKLVVPYIEAGFQRVYQMPEPPPQADPSSS
jgi:hypothetical protein